MTKPARTVTFLTIVILCLCGTLRQAQGTAFAGGLSETGQT
ncbi:hypothetical protein [Desulfonema magnum]|uniref:Uncharacterized protein n=1 Tax=Desulfonema magnum TaxID=45655 RepID=A0A975BWG8_9BACT|nr:hypothetical protein [Desulfonema magnum]QTA92647.1 Uncharacterized protein dnm_087340 [Desulfonema magnum]